MIEVGLGGWIATNRGTEHSRAELEDRPREAHTLDHNIQRVFLDLKLANATKCLKN